MALVELNNYNSQTSLMVEYFYSILFNSIQIQCVGNMLLFTGFKDWSFF